MNSGSLGANVSEVIRLSKASKSRSLWCSCNFVSGHNEGGHGVVKLGFSNCAPISTKKTWLYAGPPEQRIPPMSHIF